MKHATHFLAAAVIALTACHHKAPSVDDPLPGYGEFSVRVINRNVLDVMIYVQHSGVRNRVGLATASSTTDFVVPIAQLGAGADYQLIGDPIGQRITVFTETLHARRNDRVVWELEQSFSRSTVTVY
jgi:hypothetical protein